MIQFKSARQSPLVAILDITYADVAGIAAAMNAIELPANAIVTGGDITVTTAWNTTGTATLDLGDAADDDRYTAAAVNLKAAARTALTLTGFKQTAAQYLKALVALADEDATAGAARITVQYVVVGRSTHTQGLDYRASGVPGA